MLWQDADRGAEGRRVDVYVRCGREVWYLRDQTVPRCAQRQRARRKKSMKYMYVTNAGLNYTRPPHLCTSNDLFATYAPGTHLPSLGLYIFLT